MLISLFNSARDAQLQRAAAEGMRLYFTGVPFAGFNIILSMYFTSSARSRSAHVISLLRGFVLIIPLAFALAAMWGTSGTWCAFALSEALCAIIALLCWRKASHEKTAMSR